MSKISLVFDIWDSTSRGEILTKIQPHTWGHSWADCLAMPRKAVCSALSSSVRQRLKQASPIFSFHFNGFFFSSQICNQRKTSISAKTCTKVGFKQIFEAYFRVPPDKILGQTFHKQDSHFIKFFKYFLFFEKTKRLLYLPTVYLSRNSKIWALGLLTILGYNPLPQKYVKQVILIV